jgi:thiol-disulfide isomerase/thioredoxin
MEHFDELSIEQAFKKAKVSGKPLLIDFWSTGCKGCKKMDDLTYTSSDVLKYLTENYVFVKFNTKHITREFKNSYTTGAFLWTPTFFVFSSDKQELRRTVGYLPPNQFITELELGRAFNYLRRAKSNEALSILNQVYDYADQSSNRGEALYWAGVAAYYAHQKSFDHLAPYWNKLIELHPGSLWSERANCLDVVLS